MTTDLVNYNSLFFIKMKSGLEIIIDNDEAEKVKKILLSKIEYFEISNNFIKSSEVTGIFDYNIKNNTKTN